MSVLQEESGRNSGEMIPDTGNYIDGHWCSASNGNTFAHHNPADINDVTGHFPDSPAEDALAAITSAQKAFPAWRGLTAQKRADFLQKALAVIDSRRKPFAEIITRENGKTLAESHAEIESAIREMEYQIAEGLRAQGEVAHSATPGVLAYSMRVPLGVIGVITPWNFPFNVIIRKCSPALISGNTCVIKPASLTPRTGMAVIDAFAEAGLPPGVVNLVIGSGRNVGDTLVCDERVKAITFTGSTEVGRGIHERAAKTLTRTQLEMGGKNPLVVLEDADLEAAADAAVLAAYACAGQWCTSTSRVIVVKEIAESFIKMLCERVARLQVGNGMDPNTTIGPVCGAKQCEGILAHIDTAMKLGAKLLCGGYRVTAPPLDRGYFIEPTIFSEVTPEMDLGKEEVFGPVLALMTVEDFEDAIKVANGVRFGLASSLYTTDLKRALRFVEETDVGLTHVNMPTAKKEPMLSFGGVKESGFGIPEAGSTGIEFCTEHKIAYVRYS